MTLADSTMSLFDVDATATDHTPSQAPTPSAPTARAAEDERKPKRRRNPSHDVMTDGITKMHLHRRGNPPHMDRDVLKFLGSSIEAAYRLLNSRPRPNVGVSKALWSEGHAVYTRLALQPIDDLAKEYFSGEQMELLHWAQKTVQEERAIRQAEGTLPPVKIERIKKLRALAELVNYSIDVLSVNANMRPTKETRAMGARIGSRHPGLVALV